MIGPVEGERAPRGRRGPQGGGNANRRRPYEKLPANRGGNNQGGRAPRNFNEGSAAAPATPTRARVQDEPLTNKSEHKGPLYGKIEVHK